MTSSSSGPSSGLNTQNIYDDQVNACQLPAKQSAEGTFKNVGPVDVLLNAYRMKLGKTVNSVYQYKLSFVGLRTREDRDGNREEKRRDLSKSLNSDEAKITKQLLHWELFQQLIRAHPEFFGDEKRNLVFDCSQLLFSVKPFPFLPDEVQREFRFELHRAQMEERCQIYIKNQEEIRADLALEGELRLDNVEHRLMTGDRQITQFLEVLSSQIMHERKSHFMFGNRLYSRDNVIQLRGNEPRILRSGMQKNVRFVGENAHDAEPILQLDPKKSAFFPEMQLDEFLTQFLGCRNARELEHKLNNENEFKKIERQLKGLTVETTHLPNTQQLLVVSALSKKAARDIKFIPHGSDGQISVVDYMEQQYKLHIQNPGLPCAIQRRPQRDNYFPLELLRIVGGQRVPLEKQTPNLTQEMLYQCQILPGDLPKQIQQQSVEGKLQRSNPFFERISIDIDSSQLMQVRGERLHAPAIVYGGRNDRIEPRRDGGIDWKMPPQRRFLRPADFPSGPSIMIIIVQNIISDQDCRGFCDHLSNAAENRGLQGAREGLRYARRDKEFSQTDHEYVEDKFKEYKREKIRFVLIFAEGKNDNPRVGDIHHQCKLMETERKYGIITQHISPVTVRKWRSGKGANLVIDNVLLKLNEKLGGVNYGLAMGQPFADANNIKHDIVADEWLSKKRMFVGIDMSHPPPQNLFERQKGIKIADPTVVGMAFTTGKYLLQMRGMYWLQKARLVTFRDPIDTRPMIDAVKSMMLTFHRRNDYFPEHLVVFRGGVSEGEFKHVAFWEGTAFDQAFKELHDNPKDDSVKLKRLPKLTIIVCQKGSNYRMVPPRPQGRNAAEQNLQPGTVLDKYAMHPMLSEFLLIPHRALQGTAQPIRCTVVRDSSKPLLPLEQLRYATYHMCYGHGICTMPTSLPGPLYSANQLACRGRNNWRTELNNNPFYHTVEVASKEGEVAEDYAKHLETAEREALHIKSRDLRVALPTKYWA